MSRNILFLSLLLFLFHSSSCSDITEKLSSVRPKTIGDINLYTFSSHDQYFLSNARPFPLPADTSIEDALTSLGKHLSETYFVHEHMDPQSKILFEVTEIHEIPNLSDTLRVAVINMIDMESYAMKYFFQGSTGAQTTFCMLGATFIQPQLDSPLLDGLIILYNGKPLPELDHINLSGILTPRLFKYVAKRAISRTKIETVGMVQESASCFLPCLKNL
jgi:hypothetical protein